MIRTCREDEFDLILAIINDAAQAYEGVIPADVWRQPYMPREELEEELEAGVRFWGYEDGGELLGVMGVQEVGDVTLIRHAYVRTAKRQQGIGSRLLTHLQSRSSRPLLIGTWADASWAVRFYEKHGFQVVSAKEKDRLLRRYWTVPPRQIETSVVIADQRWFDAQCAE
ncbi:MAG: GNAT family N-acetyltransferase [Dehalococcoidia bacterium]